MSIQEFVYLKEIILNKITLLLLCLKKCSEKHNLLARSFTRWSRAFHRSCFLEFSSCFLCNSLARISCRLRFILIAARRRPSSASKSNFEGIRPVVVANLVCLGGGEYDLLRFERERVWVIGTFLFESGEGSRIFLLT